jgi:hypothetical protein
MLMRIDPATALHAATDDATATTAAAAGRVHEATDDDGRAGETATRVDAGEFSFRVLVSDEQQLMDVTRKQMQQQQQQQQQMMMQQQQQLMAQPTGYRSNNPFAPGGGGPSMSLIPESSPMPAPTPQAQPQIDFFQPAPQPAPQQQPERQGGFAVKTKDTNPELAALWANREGGLDTFGNVGSLRQSRPVRLYCFSTLALTILHIRASLQVFRWEASSTRATGRPFSRVWEVGSGTRIRLPGSSSSSNNNSKGNNRGRNSHSFRSRRVCVVP